VSREVRATFFLVPFKSHVRMQLTDCNYINSLIQTTLTSRGS
jgi:hypothetical protein